MSSSPVPNVPVEILQELEPSLQDLLDLSVLVPSFEGRPVLTPIIPELKEASFSSTQRVECIHKLIDYVTRGGNLAMTAFLGALNSTSESCEGHQRAMTLIKTSVTSEESSNQNQLMIILRENLKELEHLDIILLLPRLLHKSVITNENFRDLKVTYMSPNERVNKLLSVLEDRGLDGIIEFLMVLQESPEESNKKIGGKLISKVQDYVQSKSIKEIDKTLLLKLGRLGINMTASTRSSSTVSSSTEVEPADFGPHDKVAVLIVMTEYFQLSPKKKLETLKLPKDDWLIEWLKEQDYGIIDISQALLTECQSGNHKDYYQVIIKLFREQILPRCHWKTVLIVYLSGLTHVTKEGGTSCLLLDGTHSLSRSSDDCITDSHIKVGLDLLPTSYVTFICDCLWSKEEEKESLTPWMKLCPWDTRTVVLSFTVTLQSKDPLLQKKELMQSLKKGLISWSEERECPKISHRQFYQSLIHESESEKTLPLQIRGDVDRVLFGFFNIPCPLYLFGRLLKEEGLIECGCGYYVLGLEEGQELTVTPPTHPENVYKATISKVTGTTCIVQYSSAANIQTNTVHVCVTVPDENKIRVSTDIADRMKEDILISYLNQSSRLEHTSASGHLRVKQAFDHFEILDQTNHLQPPKVSVSSIELVKSLLERMGHYVLVRNWRNVVQTSTKSHNCFLSNLQPAMLDTKGFTVSGSSETIQDLAVYALRDDKYWMPLTYPASLNIDLKELYYISEIELAATSSNSARASLFSPVEMRLGSSKVPLVTSRYEGPLLSQKMRTIPLISIDACRQRQTQSTFSTIKISPLKMDQSVDRGMLIFNLVCASEDNEVRYVREFTILEPNLSIQCLPAPNADQEVRLDENSQQPLTVSFSNVYDSIVLRPANAPVTCTQLIVYYPENGRPVEIFDIELFMETNGETVCLEPFKKTTGISRTRLEKPYILHELTLDVQERYGLQVHLYGSPVTEKLVAKEGSNLELGFYNESPRVLSMTVMCIEQTGEIQCLLSHEEISPKDPHSSERSLCKCFKTLLPQGEDSTVDIYRVFVSCSPLQLDSLQQSSVLDYFSNHRYTVPDFQNLVEDRDEEWYCYQYTVQVIK